MRTCRGAHAPFLYMSALFSLTPEPMGPNSPNRYSHPDGLAGQPRNRPRRSPIRWVSKTVSPMPDAHNLSGSPTK